MNPSNFDKFPKISQGPPDIKSHQTTGDDNLTMDLTDRWCNNLSGQDSIDESIRSIEALITEYENKK